MIDDPSTDDPVASPPPAEGELLAGAAEGFAGEPARHAGEHSLQVARGRRVRSALDEAHIAHRVQAKAKQQRFAELRATGAPRSTSWEDECSHPRPRWRRACGLCGRTRVARRAPVR